MLIEFELFQVIITEGSQTQVIVVKEKSGDRFFPIYIGHNEAMAIDRKLNDVQVPRPLTHDLLHNIIEQMGGRLARIIVNDMRDDYYLAMLEVERDGQTIQIDSRPSDAIALAVRAECPIFVEEQVLNALQSRGT
ncbi:MAG TPA: bifunctional nuclease family protein [Planctomycetota bacterium]|nr:bifunctional nuclease family protein [Planctomycetota bacterium]